MRVLVTGVGGSLASQLVARLEARDDVERIVAVDVREPQVELRRTEVVRIDLRNQLVAGVVTDRGIDTVVHAGTLTAPGDAGGRARMKDLNVIGAMQLMAACQAASGVRRVVVQSSTAVYGARHSDPALHAEDATAVDVPDGYASDLMEVETYARELDRRRDDVTLTVLRPAHLLGPGAESALATYLDLPVVPTVLGYDPRLQLCHQQDAVAVLEQATTSDRPGTFNVAGPGVLYLSQVIARAGRTPVPVLGPVAEAVGAVLRRTGRADLTAEQLDFLRHGRAADITRLREEFGYEPVYSSRATLDDHLEARTADRRRGRRGWRGALSAVLATVASDTGAGSSRG